MYLGFILRFGALTLPCNLSHRASVRICFETGNAVIWTFVINCTTERGVRNSEVPQGCSVQVSTLLHHHMT